jgi:hypothetical protein
MKAVQLPDSFVKGLMCKIHVSLNGKNGTKELKVCMVKARSITFIEVDRVNRKNIFRKVDRKDIIAFRPTAICEITVKDGILPVKWESEWDAIGSFSPSVKSYGRMASAARPHYSNHSKGWAPVIRAPKGASMDALAVSVSTRSTTNSAAGFPMV